jgi:hypothetical protein
MSDYRTRLPVQDGFSRFDVFRLTNLMRAFDGIGLSEIRNASLLERVDTKYILGLDQLCVILPRVIGDYRALTINDIRLHAYQTLYFDTCAFTFYQQHHNGIASRYKVRARKYVDSNLAFFEVKHRTNQRRTVKTRLPIDDLVAHLDGELIDFTQAHAPCDASALEPKLWNEYLRMTLVSKDRPERVTLDINLRYRWGELVSLLPGIVIVEVKQALRSQSAAFIQQMRRLGIRPMSYSKYAAGVYSLYGGVKANNFKTQRRRVHKVMQEVMDHDGFVD